MSTPRSEYPRPRLVRDNWICLNGEWQFEIDNAKVGKEKEFFFKETFDKKITVPFCPESTLSGIGNTDFMYCVWYKRKITLPEEWEKKNIILHIGAADYISTVYVNGKLAGTHKGGYTPFSFDITELLHHGENDVTMCCEDDYTSSAQPFGKQSRKLNSYGCYYTRTTGIWQTVWLEAVDALHITDVKFTPDAPNESVYAQVTLSQPISNAKINMRVFFKGNFVGESSVLCDGTSAKLCVTVSEIHLWDIGCGNLYDTDIEIVCDNIVTDTVKSYFGLRSVVLKNGALYLNDRPVFMRLVLDQGFYPDGIYTAPDEDTLKGDILYSLELGFNGARPHEKVFDPRYLYWADRLGFLLWGEYANWGFDHTKPENIYNFLPEWLESVNRDYSHPSIIGWCPFNETWDQNGHPQFNEMIGLVYDITKKIDPTRPCIDTSGNFHVRTDIFDIHDYAQDEETFRQIFSELDQGLIKDQVWRKFGDERQSYNGEPLFISEYGGIKWVLGDLPESWGYGTAPSTEAEFKERYKTLTNILLDDKRIMGFCYTQLYDVEQETNGLMTYDRKHKFDPEFFRNINTKTAAIEK